MRRFRLSPALLIYAALLVLAEIAVRLSATPDRYPSPSGVFEALTRNILSGQAITAVEQSLSRIAVAFFFSAIAGIIIGVAIGRIRWLDLAIGPIINALRSIAPIALIPLAVLWFGVSGASAIFIVSYAAIFPIILNASEAARQVDMRLVNAASTLGASRSYVISHVVLPAAAPATITGARIAMGFAWASIVAAELAIGVKLETGGAINAGIGQIMVSSLFVDRDVNSLVGYMLIIGLIGLLIDKGFRWLHRRRAPWEYA